MIDVVDKERQALDPRLKALLDEEEHSRRGYVYCGVCSSVIAHVDDRIEVGSSHDHHFVNPYGYEFHVGCYRHALGCNIFGERTAADTWFPGYQWRHASCGECNQHLGWVFDSLEGDLFYGLIVDRIQTEE